MRDFAAMNKHCLALLLLVTALAGCGGGSKTATTPPETTTTGPAKTMPLTVFRVVDGALRAESVQVPQTQAVAGAALTALGIDARVTIDSGTATVDLDDAPPDQIAEIVYTLTQFPSVQHVDVSGRTALTRADVASFAPVIMVEQPPAGGGVTKTFTVRGRPACSRRRSSSSSGAAAPCCRSTRSRPARGRPLAGRSR